MSGVYSDRSSEIRHTPRGVWGLKCAQSTRAKPSDASYPARGMGIEITLYLFAIQSAKRHTPRGVWGLKFFKNGSEEQSYMSYPARGMGIEIVLYLVLQIKAYVIPREGYGD